MIKKLIAAAAFGVVAFGAQAQATSLVVNGGLESTYGGDYAYNAVPASQPPAAVVDAGTVAGWSGSFVAISGDSSAWGDPDSLANAAGSTSGFVAGIQADGTLTQSFDLQAGTYLLTWFDANRTNSGIDQTYAVSFGGSTIGGNTTLQGAGWSQQSAIFTLTAETTGDLAFTGLTTYSQSTDATSFIDNVSLTAVPEPTSLLLMAAGTLGLLAWRRRAQV